MAYLSFPFSVELMYLFFKVSSYLFVSVILTGHPMDDHKTTTDSHTAVSTSCQNRWKDPSIHPFFGRKQQNVISKLQEKKQ